MDSWRQAKDKRKGVVHAKKRIVVVPERPDVKAFVFLDRPEITYINLSSVQNGVIKLIRPQENTDRQGRNA